MLHDPIEGHVIKDQREGGDDAMTSCSGRYKTTTTANEITRNCLALEITTIKKFLYLGFV